MPINRYYIDAPLSEGTILFLEDPERHHLVTVCRQKLGEKVEVTNGKQLWAEATILLIEKKRVQLRIDRVEKVPPAFPIILCQAIPRLNRLEMILEKGSELGMSEIWLFPGEKSEKTTFTAAQEARMHPILLSAMKQCGRSDLPKIEHKPPLSQWRKESLPYPAFFGDLSPKAPLLIDRWGQASGCCFFVGPESGFSEKETLALQQLGAQGVKLHSYTLRTDTASLAALALIHHLSLKNSSL